MTLGVTKAVDDAGVPGDEQMTFQLVQRAQGDLDEVQEFRSRRTGAAFSEIRRYLGGGSNRLRAETGDRPGSAGRESADNVQR
ncbi:MAG: hypothetical protein M3373_12720 [Gemmatimonadota bacterium]|nr:hypothetical protein [Gemmatimonadota bacterium]